MAWRDSRSSRRRLLLFSTSIVLGIAALVAIGSFGKNLEEAVDEQAKAMLGADLVLASRQPFTAEAEALIQSLGGTQSRETSFSSMVAFPKSGDTRLVQVRALSGGFPFYGALETAPAGAAAEFRAAGGALVEEALLLQYNAQVDDPLRLGQLETRVAGSLRKVPGETVMFATIAPRVYLSMADLPKTGLLREGSLARFRVSFKFGPEIDVPQLVEKLRPQLDKFRLASETVENRKKNLGRSMENLHHFLNLVAFIALLLGGVGVASAIHVHVTQKLDTVAVLRCLGATVSQTFAIYLLQGMALGGIGAVLGGALGLAVQRALPALLTDFLPFHVSFRLPWGTVLQSMGLGFVICLLFALLPLLGVRHVSPLAAIRSSYELQPAAPRDFALWAVYLAIGAGVLLFSLAHTQRWQHGVGFAVSLLAAFSFLAGVARSIIAVVRRYTPSRLPYLLRQGLANLHRPNNRTQLLMLSLGLGTFLVLTLYLVQSTLLTQLVSDRQSSQGNTVLFDIQPDQKEAVVQLLNAQGLTVLDSAPIITMRLNSLKGAKVEELLRDKKSAIPNWALRREYRSTYSSQLRDGERLLAGHWPPSPEPTNGPAPISVEESIAKELNVKLGDELVFDVQGIPIPTRVAALREVDWKRIQPNFFVVFPPGVLDDAPAFSVLVTRVNSPEKSAALQRALGQKFPGISTIDLSLILETLDAVLNKVAFVIRFMALFTVVTGLIVLVGAILTGRYQRIRESILLRTLGASGRQIMTILVVEYFCLGLLAALTGVVLSVLASWALARFVFEINFVLTAIPLLTSVVAVSALTVVTGLLTSRGILDQPPLSVLRAEG